jgi:hypothetical protein
VAGPCAKPGLAARTPTSASRSPASRPSSSYGPNTNTSGGSIIRYEEAQAAYLRQALELVRDRGAAAIEVRPEVEEASDREVQAGFAGTAWTHCNSWYRDSTGRIVTNWPGYMRDYAGRTRVLDQAEFTFVPLPERLPAAA